MSKTPTFASVNGTTLSGAQLKTFLTGIVAAFRTIGMQETDRATITSDTTLTVQNCGLVLVDCTGGNVALTLPTSGSTTDDAIYNIRRLDSTTNTLTVTRGGSDTIEGASTAVSIGALNTWAIQLPAGGSDWKVTGRSGSTQAAARDAIGLGASTDIASAATIDLTARTGNIVRITGTTTTSAVTLSNGDQVTCVAVSAWPLAYHSTNMPLQSGQSFTCVAGDVVMFSKDGTGSLTVEIVPKSWGPAFSAYNTADFDQGGAASPPGSKLTFDSEDFDVLSCFSTANSRFTPNVPGIYQINFKGRIFTTTAIAMSATISLVKNGTSISDLLVSDTTQDRRNVSFSELVVMNGTTDYLEIFVNNNAVGITRFTGGSTGYKFSGFLVRR